MAATARTESGVAVSIWDRLSELLAAAIVASLTWVSGVVSPGFPPEVPAAHFEPAVFMLGWAQEAEAPPIEQVGEETSGDVESLDEGALPVEDAAVADSETLDEGAPPAAQDDDVELLDQGAPPITASQPVDAVYVAPVTDSATTYVAPEPAPAAASGPVLPEGFGTGQVHAVAGRGEAPIGLLDCHVGAVTGRAYVGLDCGEDEGTSFVGHAPSFEEFPFVLEAEFPFEGDEAFFTDPNFPFGDDEELAVAASNDDSSDTDVFVSARGGQRDRDDEAATDPVIETGGESSVAFAQRARDREPRVRVENRDRREDKGKKKRARAEADDGGTRAESRDNGGQNKGDNDRVNAEGKGSKKEKKSKREEKGKKGKKDRAERKEKKRDSDRR
jgi:hypothetical protein